MVRALPSVCGLTWAVAALSGCFGSTGQGSHRGQPAYAEHRARAARDAGQTLAGLPPATPNPAADALRLPRDARACYDQLWRGGVTFELVDQRAAAGVQMPIRVTSDIGGVWIAPRNQSRVHAILDCRLALRLLVWSRALREAGVAGVEHYSVYRPGARTRGSGKVSGHAHALAIDMGRLHMQNGAVLDVLTDWEERDRGDEPCPLRTDEPWGGRVLRGVVCEAVYAGLFQVVLTPHHDADHQNHVHLELRPTVDWTYIQ